MPIRSGLRLLGQVLFSSGFAWLRRTLCGSMALRHAAPQAVSSDRNDLYEVIEADEVCGVACVQGRGW